jgi:hypothetical protein
MRFVATDGVLPPGFGSSQMALRRFVEALADAQRFA